MRILQLSTRLHSGGAAAVARELETHYRAAGHECRFLYGYGPKGSPELDAHTHQIAITSRMQAAGNLVASRLIGRDFSVPGQKGRLMRQFAAADVVHLHILHSHMASFATLVDALIAAGKPVIWTMHDQWVMTGRCAFPGNCMGFQRAGGGCGPCPDLSAYPPARLDFTAAEWRRKRALLKRLADSGLLTFVSVCDWVAERLRIEFPNTACRVIRNPANRTLWATLDFGVEKSTPSTPSLLVIAADLSDPQRVNIQVVDGIARGMPHGRVVLVGRNPPSGLPENVVSLGEVRQRERLREIYRDNDALVFMCRVDTAPMVVVEGALAGLPAFMIDSPATHELGRLLGLPTYESESALVDAVTSGHLDYVDPKSLQRRARTLFDPVARVNDYLYLLAEVVGV